MCLILVSVCCANHNNSTKMYCNTLLIWYLMLRTRTESCVMVKMMLKVKVMLEYDFSDTQAEHPFLYLIQQLLDYGKDSHQALKL